jgi:hypothetical protein
MPVFFKNRILSDLGNYDTLAVVTDPYVTANIMGLSISNTSYNIVEVSVKVVNASSEEDYFLENTLIPPNSSLRVVNGNDKLHLANNNQLIIYSNLENSVDAIVSYFVVVPGILTPLNNEIVSGPPIVNSDESFTIDISSGVANGNVTYFYSGPVTGTGGGSLDDTGSISLTDMNLPTPGSYVFSFLFDNTYNIQTYKVVST